MQPIVDSTLGMKPPVSIQYRSANRKLAPVRKVPVEGGRPRPVPIGPYVTSTYVSIEATCPSSCPYKGNGCYADAGYGYSGASSLDERAEAQRYTGLETTLAEASAINSMYQDGIPQDGARGGRDLRLHIAGDVSCKYGTTALASAARRWRQRGGGDVWTYTSRWKEIPVERWEGISVLASVQKVEDIAWADVRGYASAITLVAFPSYKAFKIPGTEYKVIPCPAETRGKTCVECRLCFNAKRLHKSKLVIGFALHGRDVKKAKKSLRVLQGDVFDAVPFQLLPPR